MAAAKANKSAYGQCLASFDAHSAHVPAPRWQNVESGKYFGWSDAERRAIEFAHLMSTRSHAVTDGDFTQLVQAFGEKITACMVLFTAYCNMQDRLLTCLLTSAESDTQDESLAPPEISFDPSVFCLDRKFQTPIDVPAKQNKHAPSTAMVDPQWSQISHEVLQEKIMLQKLKPTRLPIPPWQEVLVNLPPGLFSEECDIVWYRIVFGFAPELAVPFERFMRTLSAETSDRYSRVFGTSLFWIVTRAVQCPYCMGHCEMNWEVAGLSKEDIQNLSRSLASDDWSKFTQQEQTAFSFGRKLSYAPAEITRRDLEALHDSFGRQLALFIAVQASRYHYMVRVSNGFQLRLESENVFYNFWNRMKPNSPNTTST